MHAGYSERELLSLIMDEFHPAVRTAVGLSEPLRLTWPQGIPTRQPLVSSFPTVWLTRSYDERRIFPSHACTRHCLPHTRSHKHRDDIKLSMLLTWSPYSSEILSHPFSQACLFAAVRFLYTTNAKVQEECIIFYYAALPTVSTKSLLMQFCSLEHDTKERTQ